MYPIENILTQCDINDEDYSKAVASLYDLAVTDCGGSRCAAQVLLSLYDGVRWKADLADICCTLDGNYFSQVIVAMRGRAFLMKEPHEAIQQGSQRFVNLAEDWSGAHFDQSGGR